MDEAELVALVRQAIGLHETTGCLEYCNDNLPRRIRSDPILQTVGTPNEIRAILVRFTGADGRIDYRRETRAEYQDRRECWFRVLVPITGFPYPLFYELELIDDDKDYPSVWILNVHFSLP